MTAEEEAGTTFLPGRATLDALDFVAADILLPLNGLLIAVSLGWVRRRHDALQASGLPADPPGRLGRFNLRYVVPLLALIVLAQSVPAARLGYEAAAEMKGKPARHDCLVA